MFFIIIGLFALVYICCMGSEIIMVINTYVSTGAKEMYEIVLLFHLIYLILFIINMVFEKLILKNYLKGKYENFKDFSNCYFVDKDNFNDLFGFIFKIQSNSKSLLITNLIFLILNLGLIIFELVFATEIY